MSIAVNSRVRYVGKHTAYANNAETIFVVLMMAPPRPIRINAVGTQQPVALPILRWRPERVRGTPMEREILDFAPDKPMARFHENDRPGIPFLRPIIIPLT